VLWCSPCKAIHVQPSVSGAWKLLIWAIWDDRLLLVTSSSWCGMTLDMWRSLLRRLFVAITSGKAWKTQEFFSPTVAALSFPFSALPLLVGITKSIRPVKIEWLMRCCCGCLSGVTCKWFAYTANWCHCHKIISWFNKILIGLPFWCWLTQVVQELVSWSFTSLFSTNMAISETKVVQEKSCWINVDAVTVYWHL